MKNASARMLIVRGDVKMSTNLSRTCVKKRHSLGPLRADRTLLPIMGLSGY